MKAVRRANTVAGRFWPGTRLLMPLALVMALTQATGACRQEAAPPPQAQPAGLAIATVGGTPIDAHALASQMRRRGMDARAALDELVTFELLALAAAAAADSSDVTVWDAQALQAAKVERLVAREIEPRLTQAAIGEDEVRTVYERAKPRFIHGRLVEVAVLSLFTGARMKPEPRARAEENARRLKAELATYRAPSREGLEAVAKDPRWIERRVSFTTVWQGEDQPFPAVLGRAVQALSRPGQLTDLVGDETGYYIALYLSERPPENVPLAEAAPTIRKEMYEPWRRQRFLQLTLAMAQGHDIEVFPDNFPLLTQEPAGPER